LNYFCRGADEIQSHVQIYKHHEITDITNV
jgi:hypothetical protein